MIKRNPKIKRISNISRYDVYFGAIKPKNEINGIKGKSFDELTLNEVAVIKSKINKDFETVLNIFFEDIKLKEVRIFDLYQFQKWLIDKLQILVEREKQLEIVDIKMIEAGSDKLKRFGVLNTKIELAEQFSTTPQEIGNWNYNLVFNIQLYNKLRREVRNKIK